MKFSIITKPLRSCREFNADGQPCGNSEYSLTRNELCFIHAAQDALEREAQFYRARRELEGVRAAFRVQYK